MMSPMWHCLMYHDVSPDDAGRAGDATWFSVTASSFADQLVLIRDAGFRGCTIEEALLPGPVPCVALSFDDGTDGQFERAFPLLARHDMTATFFVTTEWIGRPGHISWAGLREMRAAGMSVASHTHTHPFLSELDRAGVRQEMTISKALLDDKLGQSTIALALPGGDPPRGSWDVVHEAGYRLVATSRWGGNPSGGHRVGDLTLVRRCTIRGAPAVEVFRRILAGDRRLALARRARETVLATLRRLLGPSRYAGWRARALDREVRGIPPS